MTAQTQEILNEGLKRGYKVTIPASEINSKVDQGLEVIRSTLDIKGFRKGKAPITIVKKNYGTRVEQETLQEMIGETTNKIISDNKLKLVTAPKLKADKMLDLTQNFEYEFECEILPEFSLPDFTKIKLEKENAEITADDINEELQKFAKDNPNEVLNEDKRHKAKLNEIVVIDFEGRIDSVPFEGGKGEDVSLELGSGRFIPGFEEQLVGAKLDETLVIEVKFPDDYHAKQFAGKDAEFTVTVKKIIQKKVAEDINDEFAKAHGYENIDELRQELEKGLRKNLDEVIRLRMKKKLFDHLEKTDDFLLPETLVNKEFDALWSRLSGFDRENDPDLKGKSDEEIKQKFMDISKRRVKLGLMLDKIAEENDIKVTQAEISNKIYEMVQNFPVHMHHKIIDLYRNNPKMLENLKGPIVEDKAVDIILTKVDFKEKMLPVSELLKLGIEE